MISSLELLTGPAAEPLSIAQARAWLRLDDDFTRDDDQIAGLIVAGRAYAETVTDRAFLTQRYRLTIGSFPTAVSSGPPGLVLTAWDGSIVLPYSPLQAVESIAYRSGGTLTTWDPSRYVVVPGTPGRVRPIGGIPWPPFDYRDDALEITYRAGLGDTVESIRVDYLEAVRLAIRLFVGANYENREAVITGMTATAIPLGIDAALAVLRHGTYC